MSPRALLAMAVLWLGSGPVRGDAFPCFAAERISTFGRRFFSYVPANVRSDPPVECAFVFGGPPGYALRMSAYDVQTRGDSNGECRGEALRVYDVGRRGLQLMATYCGLLRQGQMLTMSSNMAIVTFTSDSNAMDNAFSLVVDAVERDIPHQIPCQTPATETHRETSASHENITLNVISSTTQIPEYVSTTELLRESQPTSESAEKEADISTPVPEENQSLETSTAAANRNYTTNESESNESESQEKVIEFISPEEMVGDELLSDY